LILSYHSDVVRQAGLMRLYRPLLERLLRRASRIVVATPNHLEYSPWLGPYRRKCEVIPFGIDHSRLKLTVEGQRRVAELRNSAGGLPILLNIGRLVEYKGQRFLIEAAQELRAAVWIVGVGPLDKMLRALACQLGVANRVRFWGAVGDDQLPALLTACDVFVLPSITPNEAFGLVQVEAMACGKPVISCSLRSGVPWVNQAGQTGLIVPPADAKALASACRQLLQDEGLRARLGQTGRQRAEREFDETVMVKRYWQCFERVLGDKCQA
jgi:rhamnosyl/mannosyltransferase